MPAQANLKSTAITNLDATPPVRPTAGQDGGQTVLYEMVGKAGPTTSGATTGGILRMCRLPSNAIVRDILIAQVAATTTATFDVGAYYSDGNDGTSVSNSGAVIDADFFGTAIDTHLLISWTSVMFEATTVTVANTIQPLWQALGLLTDPGGYIDITLTNTATISGAATLLMRVQYCIAAV